MERNGGNLVEEDGKNIQLSTKVAKILQTQTPILVLDSGLDGDITHTVKRVHLVNHRQTKGKRAQRCWKEVKLQTL